MSKLSVSIITYNEESNIERCLKSLDFADEIVVVDSLSQDKTVEICERYGAKVIHQKFLGYGQQKNLAGQHCSHDWIFNIDADEVVTEELRENILKAIESPNQLYLYKVSRLTNYCGKWIRFGGWYPNAVYRLYHKEKARWSEPHIHEALYLEDGTKPDHTLKGDLLHYSFPTVKSQIMTNVKFAELGAKDLIKRKNGRRPSIGAVLIRPFGKFIECYFIKFGIFDGLVGLVIALNASHSMFMKYSFAYFDKLDAKD